MRRRSRIASWIKSWWDLPWFLEVTGYSFLVCAVWFLAIGKAESFLFCFVLGGVFVFAKVIYEEDRR